MMKTVIMKLKGWMLKEKSDEDATYVEDQGNEADRDTNANLEGRDDVKAYSSFVSSGFVSNMLNPNQDTAILLCTNQSSSNTDSSLHSIITTTNPDTATPSSSLQNLPDIGSLFDFNNRLKDLEDNFSEFKQTNQYAEALSSTPGIVDQYLANKIKEAVDVAVQLKSDRIREEAQAKNQQFLESIDEGMKKVIKEQVKSEVSKITPQIEKLVNEQLESEVLVRSLKEAKTSHAVAANLSELELKKILIDKMEANKSISKSDIQSQLYKALVKATLRWNKTWGFKKKSERPESTSAPREKTPLKLGKTTTGPTFELMKGTCKSLTELEYFCEEVYKATTKKLDWINPEGRQYPHDLRKPLPLVPNSQGENQAANRGGANSGRGSGLGLGGMRQRSSTNVAPVLPFMKSRIKRYIDTKPNSELIYYCLQNPPYTYQWAEKTVPVAERSSETTIERDRLTISTPQLMLVRIHVKCGKPLKATLLKMRKCKRKGDDKLMALISLLVQVLRSAKSLGFSVYRLQRNRACIKGMSETEMSKGCNLSQGKDVIELEAHYMYMAQIQEVTPDSVDNSGPIFDDESMHKVQNNNDNYNVFAMEK
ncbi:hypothetical protein Tco_1292136 [Tanacetum coccineum]